VLFVILVFGFVLLFCLCSFSDLFPILHVSLDCSYLIAPSVFSNVYLIGGADVNANKKYRSLSEAN